MAKRSFIRTESNLGLPSDRRTSKTQLTSPRSPADAVSLAGSGYDRKWPTAKSTVPGMGFRSRWKGYGGF